MNHRLPRDILPRHYALEIEPDIQKHSFHGHVTISAEVMEATDRLVCNCADLDLRDVRIDGADVAYTVDPASERLTITFDTARSPGPIELQASFTGELNDQLKGFYRSTFHDDDGVEHTIATTQFQSTDARRAFPCWDEPDFKATFAISLVVDPDMMAISNGAELSRVERSSGKVAVAYETTMVMSTYLVAFVVGPLEVSETAWAGDVPVRIVHRPGQGGRTAFALEVAVAALRYFEEYYGIEYPSGKLDMIALPDFAMGAMENLGCVTYREILLLVDPDEATQPELQNVADVVNHELAHMWFGDLVTMGWWNGIWLNEAFATFMELKATDKFRPEWERWTSFGIGRSEAFDVDSLEATRPIEYPVHSPDDAEGMFDQLTYEKGAAVVRMLEQWLGEEVFRDGIRHYLRQHEFANTDTHDLWDALEEVAGRPVRRWMETWIFQGGHPVITLTETGIEQTRFSYGDLANDSTWYVPIHLRTENGDEHLIELDQRQEALPVPATDVSTLNAEGRGFYRVNLGGERLTALGTSGTQDLPAIERFGLVDDAWALTLAGTLDLPAYLRLLEGYAQEDDVSVWQKIVRSLGFLHHVAPDDSLAPFAAWVQRLLTPARDGLGMEVASEESDRTRQLRGTLFATAGTIGDDMGARGADRPAGGRRTEIRRSTDRGPQRQRRRLRGLQPTFPRRRQPPGRDPIPLFTAGVPGCRSPRSSGHHGAGRIDSFAERTVRSCAGAFPSRAWPRNLARHPAELGQTQRVVPDQHDRADAQRRSRVVRPRHLSGGHRVLRRSGTSSGPETARPAS
ncbi:MAG: M1 family peptidase [Acidimicrobiales bacterium]|nr:MAG: M1 family peptidase [Acidimicrobiales bacterium]